MAVVKKDQSKVVSRKLEKPTGYCVAKIVSI
jgi:hypothetical protein